jgi:hypothetical protein
MPRHESTTFPSSDLKRNPLRSFPFILFVTFLACLSPASAQYLGSLNSPFPSLNHQMTLPQGSDDNYAMDNQGMYAPLQAAHNYNLQVGPFGYSLYANATAIYNDNINLTSEHEKHDLIFDPMLTLDAAWNVTEDSSLTVNVGAGYFFYLNHPEDDRLSVDSASTANYTYNFMVGEINMSAFVGLGYQQDPLLVPQLHNTSDFPVLSLDAGLGAFWQPINDVTFSIEYAHNTEFVLPKAFGYLSGQSDSVSLATTVNLGPGLSGGINSSVARNYFQDNVQNGSYSLIAGGFFNARFNDYLSLNSAAGFTGADYDRGGSNGDQSDLGSWYASTALTYQISEFWSIQGSLGKDYFGGITSNYTEDLYAKAAVTWQTTSQLSTTAFIGISQYKDSGGYSNQTTKTWDAGLGANYLLNPRTNISINAKYSNHDSSIQDFSYRQDQISTSISYSF